MLSDYPALKGIKGSIEAAVELALQEADNGPAILKRSPGAACFASPWVDPWLAGIDPDSGSPRRRAARKSEIASASAATIKDLVRSGRLQRTFLRRRVSRP